MQKYFLIFTILVLGSVAAEPTPAVSAIEKADDAVSSKPAGIKESDRLMQEYMAQRAKLVELRREAKKQAESAKTPIDRTRILQKLQSDEQVLRAAADDAKQRYRALVQPKRRIVIDEKLKGTN